MNFHLNFHKTSTPPLSRKAQKKRKHLAVLPLENRLIFKGFILLEVALQQALEGAAMTGLVAGHLVHGVVDGVEAVLLRAQGEVKLAARGAELAT